MDYELSCDEDFNDVLNTLEGDVNGDNIGVVHSFFDQIPDEYNLDSRDIDYLKKQGLDGLETLGQCVNYFMTLKDENKSGFSSFTKNYPQFLDDLEEALTPVNRRFSVSRASSSSRAVAGISATRLVNAGMAEKQGAKKTYRMTESMEDYRMVEDIIEKIDERHRVEAD